MKNKIKTLITAGALALSLGASQDAIAFDKPKVFGSLTGIIAKENSISRGELGVTNLPLNSDFYGILQEDSGDTFKKARLQSLPLKIGPFAAGGFIDYTDGNRFKGDFDSGIVARVSGKPTEGTYAKIDVRFSPQKDQFESYAFVDSRKILVDIVSSYNPKTDATFIQPGVDYKLTKNISLGVEGQFAGENLDLEKNYLGLRGKINF